ncbi:hypothetical protein V6N13_132906 [Hibiscus sabdariffa]|uniref:Uncharacterized protein n=1 Tax=Hibiscus sabdariffa TaxID=183260 RepID=A0ABR2PWM8_9ROSI
MQKVRSSFVRYGMLEEFLTYEYQPNWQAPVSSTSNVLKPQFQANADEPMKFSPPRRLSTDEIPQIVNEFRLAARNAMEAGK